MESVPIFRVELQVRVAGNDPRSYVADREGRLHGVTNVYIANGSLLPNPGGANPALTIQALAYWVSSHILL